jgi:hypothetical protein
MTTSLVEVATWDNPVKKIALDRKSLLGYRVWGASTDQAKLGSKSGGSPVRVGAKGPPDVS